MTALSFVWVHPYSKNGGCDISMTNELGTPTTLCMMTPCFQTFSIGLRCTHTLSQGSKFTFLVLDESSKGCHSATSSGLLLWMTGKLDANKQPKNNSAGLSLDFIYNKGVVQCTSNPDKNSSPHLL